MFMKSRNNGDLVEIIDLQALYDPNLAGVRGRFHAGEEMPDESDFDKAVTAYEAAVAKLPTFTRAWTPADRTTARPSCPAGR